METVCSYIVPLSKLIVRQAASTRLLYNSIVTCGHWVTIFTYVVPVLLKHI